MQNQSHTQNVEHKQAKKKLLATCLQLHHMYFIPFITPNPTSLRI